MGTDDWKEIHQELVGLARAQAAADFEIGRWLLAAQRARVDLYLGYASVLEYGERLFGYNRRLIAERLWVARALEELPALAAALRGGALSWSAVRELTRVATAETERAWLEAARGRTAREVEGMVSGRQVGDRPEDPVREEARRHVLRFEVSAQTLALIREAQACVARDAGGHLSDDEALALMARQILGGPADAGRAGYQIAVCLCPSCGQATQQGSGSEVVLGMAATELAGCDAQVLELPPPVPSLAHAGEGPERGTSSGLPDGRAHVGGRATQSIPPAVRRRVLRRDRGRCVVPGCRHAIVDCHHLRRRADGGGHGEDNLVAMCTAHHTRVHAGTLIVEGRPSTGLRFSHADGSVYGGAVSAAVDAFAEAFRGLVTLGFGEGEARRALAAARARVGREVSTEVVLRAALGLLRRARERRRGWHRRLGSSAAACRPRARRWPRGRRRPGSR